MRPARRTLGLILLVILYAAAVVSPASAHAMLLRSEPPANAILQGPPAQVGLFFSEAVDRALSTIQVYDSTGAEVDAGDLQADPADPAHLTVSLQPLGDGVYTVSWKAASSTDGHQSVGTFPFAVGNVSPDAVSRVPQSTGYGLPAASLIARFLMLAALALLAGRWFFTALIWKPALRAAQSESAASLGEPAVWGRLYRLGLIVLLFSTGLGILAQAGQSGGAGLALPWDPETGRMLLETRLGLIWLLRLGLAMLSVWLAGRHQWGGFAVSLALLLTIALTSHAAGEARPLLPVLADWIHLTGMTFWLGGIVYLFTGARHVGQLDGRLRTTLTSLLMRKFSASALVAVALVGLTGLYSAYLRVGDLSALLNSLYGNVLLVKQLFVAGLLAVAATDFLVISPRLNRERMQGSANPRLVSLFGKILIADLVFAGLLLASASLLSFVPPAKPAAPAIAEFTGSQRVGDLTVEIDVSPARVGQNEFMMVLFTGGGQPVTAAREVLLRFTPAKGNLPPSELQLTGDGYGMYMAQGGNLSMPGKWQVQAVVQRQDKFDAYANFDLTLHGPAGSEPARIPRQAGALLIILGVLGAVFAFTVPLKPSLRLGVGLPAALLLIALGLLTMIFPAVP